MDLKNGHYKTAYASEVAQEIGNLAKVTYYNQKKQEAYLTKQNLGNVANALMSNERTKTENFTEISKKRLRNGSQLRSYTAM